LFVFFFKQLIHPTCTESCSLVYAFFVAHRRWVGKGRELQWQRQIYVVTDHDDLNYCSAGGSTSDFNFARFLPILDVAEIIEICQELKSVCVLFPSRCMAGSVSSAWGLFSCLES
jgi:hypothetical protein